MEWQLTWVTSFFPFLKSRVFISLYYYICFLGKGNIKIPVKHTCPIYEHNEIHDNFVRHHSVPFSLRTASTVVWLGFGGVRVSRTLYDAYITCQESHYPGVLDNPPVKSNAF